MSADVAPAQEAQTPAGYQFFARRHRTTPTAWTRIPESPTAKSASRPQACCRISDDPQAPRSPLADQPETASTSTDLNPVQQTNWGAEFGLNYGWTEEGYYPGTSTYPFGKTYPYPLHGYAPTYNWAGHEYCMHCYCSKGYCPHHCPGYRGACYVPCWNDAGTPIIERRCGRGSGFDCFWHMGGYECRCRRSDCPYVCEGPPSFNSFGFPQGTAGDPNYVKPRGAENNEPWKMRPDPYGAAPATKPARAPAKQPIPPQPAADPSVPPTPKPPV